MSRLFCIHRIIFQAISQAEQERDSITNSLSKHSNFINNVIDIYSKMNQKGTLPVTKKLRFVRQEKLIWST